MSEGTGQEMSQGSGEPISTIRELSTAITAEGMVRLQLTTHEGRRIGLDMWPDQARAYAAMLDQAADETDRTKANQ